MKSSTLGLLRAGVALLALSTAAPGRAEDPRLLPSPLGLSELYATRSGLGLAGYDPVSYWFPAGPAHGRSEHVAEWGGLLFRFVDAANRAAFLRDPDTFLPRVGGFDAQAMAAGHLTDSDPRYFAILDRRLWLFRDPSSRARFLEDAEAPARAEAAWPSLKAGLVGG